MTRLEYVETSFNFLNNTKGYMKENDFKFMVNQLGIMFDSEFYKSREVEINDSVEQDDFPMFLKIIKHNVFTSNEQGKCPRCNSIDNVEYGSMELEGEMFYYHFECLECGLEGEEWYNMTFNGHSVYNEEHELIEVEDNMGGTDQNEKN